MSVSAEVAAAVVIAERRSARNGCPERWRVCLLRRLCMSSCIVRLRRVHAIVVWLARREGRVRSVPRQPMMHRRRHTCRRRHGNCPELMAVDRRRHRQGVMVAQAVRVRVMMRLRHVGIQLVPLLPLLPVLPLLHARHLLAPRPHLRLGVALPVHAGVAGLVRRHAQRMRVRLRLRLRLSVVLSRLVSLVAR